MSKNRDYVDMFETYAYSGHLSFLWRIGGESEETIEALSPAVMDEDAYIEDLRANVPITEWFFAVNDWHPSQTELAVYNRIMQLTMLGKALGATEGEHS